MYICIHIYANVCTYAYTHTYIYIERERERERVIIMTTYTIEYMGLIPVVRKIPWRRK